MTEPVKRVASKRAMAVFVAAIALFTIVQERRDDADGTARVDVREVTVLHTMVDAIAYEPRFGGMGNMVSIEGVSWLDSDGNSYSGSRPECLPVGSSGARLEVGFVDPQFKGKHGYPARMVAYVKCLSGPTSEWSTPRAAARGGAGTSLLTG